MRCIPCVLSLLPLFFVVWTGCSDGSNTPSTGFAATSEPGDVGASADASAPDASRDETEVEVAPPPLDAARETSSDSGDILPTVWTASVDQALPCDNRRVEFDFDPSERRFSTRNAFWMMWLAMRAYVSEVDETRSEFASLGFSRYQHIDGASGMQAMIVGSNDMVWVGFRGSTDIADYLTNARFALMEGEKLGVEGRIHAGFGNAVQGSWESVSGVIDSFAHGGREIWLSGHSLGGAMALMAAVKLAGAGHNVAAVYTFAAPRVGDSAFAEDALERLGGRSYRVVNHLDLSPRIPPAGIAAEQAAQIVDFDLLKASAADLIRALDYAHAGGLFLFDEADNFEYLGTPGDWEDRVYWSDRAEHVSSLIGLVEDNSDNFFRHEQATYLCKMQTLRSQELRLRQLRQQP